MISVVIPSFEPNFNDFMSAINSALATNTNEIIIIDDNSNRKNNEKYFDFLKNNNDERIKVIYNKKNKGRYANSLFALNSASNEYVKKLDVDDKLDVEGFNQINKLKLNEDIIFTQFIQNGKIKNQSKENKWNLFNGSSIYKTSKLKDLSINNPPKNFFGDVIFILHILSKKDSTYSFQYVPVYIYDEISSTTPKSIIKDFDDWYRGLEWIKENALINEITKFTIEKQFIFYELMCVKLNKEMFKYKYEYFSSFNRTPKFIKKIISYFVFKI